MITWESFDNIWVVDYEYYGDDADPKIPVIYSAKNLKTGEFISHWITKKETQPLYSCDPKSLFVSFFAPAELSCHLTLKFPFPLYIIDLWAEFLNQINGKRIPGKKNLLLACEYYGIKGGDIVYKESMRNIILRGPPFSDKEQADIALYNKSDIILTEQLFYRMKKYITLGPALFRGRYMGCITKMEALGIPLDLQGYNKISTYWNILKEELIWRVDEQYHVFDGTTFKKKKFQEYLDAHKIPWEYTESGLPTLDQDFLKDRCKLYPELNLLRELLHSLDQLKLKNLQIGRDGRNHASTSPFGSKTGRNQPSSSKHIFGNAVWVRSFIKPPPEKAVAYVDFSQEEMGIAAALSNDPILKKAYCTGDIYLATAKMMCVVPESATKKTHPNERELFKTVSLAINYGMKEQGVALKANISVAQANIMLKFLHQKYRRFFEWSTSYTDTGILRKQMSTRFGLNFDTSKEDRINSLLNWPIQSHGSDVIRLSICLCIQEGIPVCAAVHDALLVEDTKENIEKTVAKTRKLMEDASEVILHFRLRTDAKIVYSPNRYMDPRGEEMWKLIWDTLNSMNPSELETRLYEKIDQNISLDAFDAPATKIQGNISKKRRGQLLLKPMDITEKNLIRRIQQKSHLSYVEVMALIRLARDSDYDLEEMVDWPNESYTSARRKILADINPSKASMKHVTQMGG